MAYQLVYLCIVRFKFGILSSPVQQPKGMIIEAVR
jgi:hypothetical protein